MNRKVPIILLFVLNSLLMGAQPAVDTLLFTIALNDDTISIYGCRWNDDVASTLAGPVLMAGKHLLFYSENGYVMYDEKGKLLDSHSLIRENNAARRKGEPETHLAYPLDSLSILYYRKSGDPNLPNEIYQKKIFKKGLKKVTTAKYEIYGHITSGQLFNLAANSITDEMGNRRFLEPLLVGYTALEGGTRWWTTDRLYSFTSPLIVEHDGKLDSFFPGLKKDQVRGNIKAHQIEPLGVYQTQGRWYYFGLASNLGNRADEYFQMLVLCDQAGNLLYSSKLIKQKIGDALLQYVKKSNTNYTVRKAVRHVFVPAVDRRGDICYGMIDFENRVLHVYKRMFLRYFPKETGRLTAKVFQRANELAYTPLLMDCIADSDEGVVPEITRLTDDGIVALSQKSLMRKGFYITVHRVKDDKLKTKLERTQERLPRNMQKAQKKILKNYFSWCPYSLALNHEKKGRLNFLHYGMSDELLSARLLAVTDKMQIFVRVDCETWAEVVQFDQDGSFVNRFVFNRQDYRKRKDLVVVGKSGNVAEEDFEEPKGRVTYYIWSLESAGRLHVLK